MTRFEHIVLLLQVAVAFVACQATDDGKAGLIVRLEATELAHERTRAQLAAVKRELAELRQQNEALTDLTPPRRRYSRGNGYFYVPR